MQSLLEVHRYVTLACTYPTIVFIAAYSLLLLMLSEMIPRFNDLFETFRMPLGGAMQLLKSAAESMPYWGPVIPVTLVLAIVYWIFLQRRVLLTMSGSLGLFRCFPWAGGFARNLRIANFSHLLALLTDHQVPLHVGLTLAAEGTGHRAMIGESKEISAKLQKGESLADSMRTAKSFPPYLRWLIQNGEQQGGLTASLNRASDVYRSRSMNQLESLKIFLPLLIIVVVGGGTVFLYAMALFAPLIESLRGLAAP